MIETTNGVQRRIMHLLTATLLLSYVVTSPESQRSSFFEGRKGYALSGHVIGSCVGSDLTCGLRCLRHDRCQSYNCLIAKAHNIRDCRLNGETKKSKPENYKKSEDWIHYEPLQVTNAMFMCNLQGKTWSSREILCRCKPGYKGSNCQTEKLGYFSSHPGLSCKHIRDFEDSCGDGEYWIDPEKNGNPLKVFCDMTTDGGGWLLVANFISPNSSSPVWAAEESYRGISGYHNNHMGISKGAMKQLRRHLYFTQLRFHCSKQGGRTFHVTSIANSTGEAVVRYFSDQSNVLPASCGSFQRMSDDNSYLSMTCYQWGNEGSDYAGKWGHYKKKGRHRMYNHAAFVADFYLWKVKNDTWKCDDGEDELFPQKSGNFWKIFVR